MIQQSFLVQTSQYLLSWVSPAANSRLRAQIPQLRLAAVLLIFSSVLTCVVGLGMLWQWQVEKRALQQSALEAITSIKETFAEVERDLLPLGALWADEISCSPSVQKILVSKSYRAHYAQEYLLQEPAAQRACSGLGEVAVTWPPIQGDTFQISSRNSIEPMLIAALATPESIRLAYIQPRQLTDRLFMPTEGQSFELVAADGQSLLHLGQNNADLALYSQEHPIPGFALGLKARIYPEALKKIVAQNAAFWLAFSGMLALLVVLYANRLVARQFSIAARLDVALRKRRFVPVVQPIVDAQTGRCVGAEVLMRWKSPARGLVGPAEFIDYAERSGLIAPMSELIMRQARHQLADIARQFPHLYFSFNVTPQQLRDDSFATLLNEIFDGEPLGPSRVVLELTERDLVDAQSTSLLTRLRSQGFQVAIDDFGTGQSSLALLQELPIDKLKVDRAFVQSIDSHRVSHAPILDAILQMAKSLGMTIVAEGVETQTQAEYLKAHQVESIQGYLYSPPLTPSDFSSWLHKRENVSAAVSIKVASALPPLDSLFGQLLDQRHVLERSRWHHLRRYPRTILGSDLVSWLSAALGVNRAQALRFGQGLVACGYLSHCVEEHDLEDAPFFYRLSESAALNQNANSLPLAKPLAERYLAALRGSQGLGLRARTSWLLKFHQAFSGLDLLQALRRTQNLSDEQATHVASQLIRLGLVRHCLDERGFTVSAQSYYRLA